MNMEEAKVNVEQLRTTFAIFDENGDGSIDGRELGSALRALGLNPTESDVREIISSVDKDFNGQLDFDEFLDCAMRYPEVIDPEKHLTNEQQIEQLQAALAAFDVDKDGVLEVAELKSVLMHFGEPLSDTEFSRMMELADVRPDGTVDYKEFARSLVHKPLVMGS